MRVQREVAPSVRCGLEREGWRTGSWPGKDRCPRCGRMVYTKSDGTCEPHFRPKNLRGRG